MIKIKKARTNVYHLSVPFTPSRPQTYDRLNPIPKEWRCPTLSIKLCKTGDHRRIVRVPPVAVDLHKIRKDFAKQIHRISPLRAPSDEEPRESLKVALPLAIKRNGC